MGAGGIYFYKPQAKHNFLNDIDNNIYNLWQAVREHKEELIREIKILPLHEKLWKEYKKKEINDPILKSVIFLMYSNFGVYGRPDTLIYTNDLSKKKILNKIDIVFDYIQDAKFMCCDFRKVINKINFSKSGCKT
jgi:DNA adenine methylase